MEHFENFRQTSKEIAELEMNKRRQKERIKKIGSQQRFKT
jgi:hypothetical protein